MATRQAAEVNKHPAYPTVQLRDSPYWLHTGGTWGASGTWCPGFTPQRFWFNYSEVGLGAPGDPDVHPGWEHHDTEKGERGWEGKSQLQAKLDYFPFLPHFLNFSSTSLGPHPSVLCVFISFEFLLDVPLFYLTILFPKVFQVLKLPIFSHGSVNFHFLRAADIN